MIIGLGADSQSYYASKKKCKRNQPNHNLIQKLSKTSLNYKRHFVQIEYVPLYNKEFWKCLFTSGLSFSKHLSLCYHGACLSLKMQYRNSYFLYFYEFISVLE